ncbi:MAG TPA: hypothetical protein VKA44_09170 [Gemmatimonadota bacterium]|nr:hypothetical protein [Gemmatimonadota bacterium]
MRSWLIGLTALVVTSGSAAAQSLDIGGVEVHLGEAGTVALRQLRAAYNLQYVDGAKAWGVTRKNGPQDYTSLGMFSIDSGTVTWISKDYEIPDVQRLGNIFQQAVRDLRARGGKACFMWPNEMTNGMIFGASMKCGPYTLDLNLPRESTAIPSMGAGISIRVGGRGTSSSDSGGGTS